MNAKAKSKISRRKPFFLSLPLNLWARTEICTIKFRRAPPAYERATLQAKIVPKKGGKQPEAMRRILGGKTFLLFLVFTPEFEVKFFCAPQIFFLPPPPPQSSYSGTGPDMMFLYVL